MKGFTATPFIIGAVALGLIVALAYPRNESRSSVSSRMDRIAAALEAYAIDNNGKYPPTSYNQNIFPTILTTPIGYVTRQETLDPKYGTWEMPFKYQNIDYSYGESTNPALLNQYPYYYSLHGSWLIWSGSAKLGSPAYNLIPYDATNGALSEGTAFRSQRLNSEIGVMSSAY